MNNESVDSYLKDGCGRCAHFKTPQCKVLLWTPILKALRDCLRETTLVEEMKWGSPCYTLQGKNVVMIASFRHHCALSFFHGAQLPDADSLLEKAGPNSNQGRLLKFHSLEDFRKKRKAVQMLIEAAIALEKEGRKAVAKAQPEPMPLELKDYLAQHAKVAKAFDALTPGRKRSHILYISSAKQAETRKRRVERCVDDILEGRGMNER